MTCGVKTDFILVYTALCQYFSYAHRGSDIGFPLSLMANRYGLLPTRGIASIIDNAASLRYTVRLRPFLYKE